MRAKIGGLTTAGWGLSSSRGLTALRATACFILAGAGTAAAGPAEPTIIPDPPPRGGAAAPSAGGPSSLPPSWDLDGLYVWLGPVGAAGRLDGAWDSAFGADLAVVRVREAAPLGAVGVAAGAARWAERGGGRIWLDGLVGTRLGGRMYGATLGPVIELAELAHTRVGGAVGIWAFFGPTPYARVGVIADGAAFVEVGIHLALPVLRWRSGG
jgi:hypothetical protein